MKHLKTPQELNESSENLNISDVIERFRKVRNEYISLNTKIKNYYTPLLIKCIDNKDRVEFERLLSEIPDCPFSITAQRMSLEF